MSPLRDAVGLVDHEQRDAACAQQIEVLGILQALRRHVDEVVGAVRDLFRRLALLACRQRRVELRHLDARGLRLLLLVLHQRKQRRDDDHRFRQEERGKLVGERLPGAGGQETERIAAPERSFEQLLLSRAKRSHPKPSRRLASHRAPVDGRAGRPPSGPSAPFRHGLKLRRAQSRRCPRAAMIAG